MVASWFSREKRTSSFLRKRACFSIEGVSEMAFGDRGAGNGRGGTGGYEKKKMEFNYDAYNLARDILNEKISIPDYYMDNVDEEVDLEVHNKDCCPLHDESSPSFFYVEEKRIFHCFGCGKGGGVTELHYHLNHRLDPSYTKTRALRDLATMYNVEIPNLFKAPKLTERKSLTTKKKIGFKRPEDLVRPRKKMETDFAKEVLKNRIVLGNVRVKELLDEMDEIYFRDADVTSELAVLREKYVGYLRESSN